MSTTPLTTTLKVRNFTGADETTVPDSLITKFISDAEDLIEEKTGKRFEIVVITDEVHDGNNKAWMILDHNPVIELTKVLINDIEKSLSLVSVYHRMGKIVLKQGVFSSTSLRNIKISYTYGEPNYKIADEIAFNMACARTLICMGIKESQGAISEKLGSDYTLKYPSSGPYSGQINELKDAIKDGLDSLGYKLDFGIT